MLRSGKDQNNERSESNSTLWYNFRLNYSQVLQLVVSTQRQVAQIILSNYGNALSALNQSGFMDKHLLCWACRRHMKKVFLVFQSNWAVCSGLPQTVIRICISMIFTARCYAERGYEIAYRPSVCLSVRDVEVWFSHRLEYFENKFTAE